jgi:hypothetical protein
VIRITKKLGPKIFEIKNCSWLGKNLFGLEETRSGFKIIRSTYTYTIEVFEAFIFLQ